MDNLFKTAVPVTGFKMEANITGAELVKNFGFEVTSNFTEKDHPKDTFDTFNVITYSNQILQNLCIEVTELYQFKKFNEPFQLTNTTIEILQGGVHQEIKIIYMWQFIILLNILTNETES